MSLHGDLLEQARQLAHHEPMRPKQASLRRAVSTAYYALFHLLADAASRELVSGQGQDALRQSVARALKHSDMKAGCQALANWNQRNPPRPLAAMLPNGPSAEAETTAAAFVELQQARHEADYDLSRRFTRSDVLALLSVAEGAFTAFRRLDRNDSSRRILLFNLVFHGRWKR